MKRHIRVDSQSSRAHSAVVTAADVHDKYPLPDLLHGHEQRVYGDHAYMSPNALIHCKAPKAKDFTNCRTSKPSRDVDEVKRSKNRNKSKNRARVEHLFAVVKRLLGGFTKVRCPEAWSRIRTYLSTRRLMAQVCPWWANSAELVIFRNKRFRRRILEN